MSTSKGPGVPVEVYVCECGEQRYRIPGVDHGACLACEAHEAIGTADYLASDEFDRLCSRAGRIHYPGMLWAAWNDYGCIDAVTVTAMVGEAWQMCEFPDRTLEWGQWRELFDVAGYTVDGKPARRPHDPVRLYRAAPLEYRAGHSWTEDIEVAKEFLTAGGRSLIGKPQLWQAEVEPVRLLARTWRNRATNGEPQYVVETEGLEISAV